jgi:anti-sigma factor RsiW
MDDERLEAMLTAYAAAEPDSALRARIIGAAPRQRAIGRAWRWAAGLALGVGLAGSCAAGVAAGFTLTPGALARTISGSNATVVSDSLADPAGDAATG